METFLLWFSSLVMAGLLLCLAGRGINELILPTGCHAERQEQRPNCGTLPWPVVFFGALAVLWLGTFGAYLVQTGGVEGYLAHFVSRFTEAGDGPHYLFIAENGYVAEGENAKNIVFYPLYPLLIRALSIFTGGNIPLAGMILSQVCFGLSAVFMAKLAAGECTHPRWAVAGYLLYPFGFFSLGLFTEGLFLFLTVLGLWLIRERKWLWLAPVGFLCALTRTQGVLLLLPGVYMAWRQCREEGWKWSYLTALAPILGFFVYLSINKLVIGDFFAYPYYESIEPWWQTPQWLGKTVAQQWRMAQEHPGLAKWIYWPQLFLYFIGAALMFSGFKNRLDMPWLLYGTAYLGMCYTASWLISGGRYMLGCIPMFLAVGRIRSPVVRTVVLVLELLSFALVYRWYIQGQAIM